MRIREIDIARGIAVLLMVIYHLIFDLDYLGMANIDLQSIPLVVFQRTIGTMFVGIAGIAFALSLRENDSYVHHAKRGALLAGVAILITTVTWIYPHDGFITFGVIHMLALSAFVAPLFARFGKMNILFGLIAIAIGLAMSGMTTQNGALFWLGLTTTSYTALDFYPMLPWFGIFLIGMAVGNEMTKVKWKETNETLLSLIGKNSLAIYLVHQVVLIGLLLAARQIV